MSGQESLISPETANKFSSRRAPASVDHWNTDRVRAAERKYLCDARLRFASREPPDLRESPLCCDATPSVHRRFALTVEPRADDSVACRA